MLFFAIFASFLKFISNFEHFREKDDLHKLCIFEITDGEIYAYLNA